MEPAVPSSNAFWIRSSGYRDAGNAAFELMRSKGYKGSIKFACLFLYFRYIELSLKAIFTHHGVAERQITQALEHRIAALLARAEAFSPLDVLGMSCKDRS